jgi:hypothetical protein
MPQSPCSGDAANDATSRPEKSGALLPRSPFAPVGARLLLRGAQALHSFFDFRFDVRRDLGQRQFLLGRLLGGFERSRQDRLRVLLAALDRLANAASRRADENRLLATRFALSRAE